MTKTAQQIVQTEFHSIRAKILEIAAFLDRVDRAEGSVEKESQMQLIQSGIDILKKDAPNRAEQVQLLMSRSYDPQWPNAFQLELKR